jgi:hypothetical protein
MARPPARFRRDDVTRAVRGVEAAGHRPTRCRIMPDGTIDVVLVEETPAPDAVVNGASLPAPKPPGDIVL